MFTQIWFLPFHFKQPVPGDEENKSPVSLDQGLTAALGALQDDCAITPPHSTVQHSVCLYLRSLLFKFSHVWLGITLSSLLNDTKALREM